MGSSFELHFSAGDTPVLTACAFTPANGGEIKHTTQGKDFGWGTTANAVVAMSLCAVAYKAWYVSGQPEAIFQFVGETGSPAHTLRGSLLKDHLPAWFRKVFGERKVGTRDRSYGSQVFHPVRPPQSPRRKKKKQLAAVTVDSENYPAERFRILRGDKEVSSAPKLVELAQQIQKQGGWREKLVEPDLKGLQTRRRPGDSEFYQLVARFDKVFHRTFLIASARSTSEFLGWSTFMEHGPLGLLRVYKDGITGQWKTETLPVRAWGDYLLLNGKHIVAVRDPIEQGIQVISRSTGDSVLVTPPRNYQWKMVTDAKLRGETLLLAYCGGDVWRMDLETNGFVEVKKPDKGCAYSHVDFLGRDSVAVGDDGKTGISIISLNDGRLLNHFETPDHVMAIKCFAEANRIVVGCQSRLCVFRATDGKLLKEQETLQGIFRLDSSNSVPAYGFIAGMFASNIAEVHHLGIQNPVFKRRADLGRSWDCFAFSWDGNAFALVDQPDLLIFERRADHFHR